MKQISGRLGAEFFESVHILLQTWFHLPSHMILMERLHWPVALQEKVDDILERCIHNDNANQ